MLFSRDPGSKERAERKRRAESAFKSGELPKNPPAELKDAPTGRAAWRALMRAHDQLPGELFTGLDRGFLVGYCLAVQARQRAIDLERKVSELFEKGNTALQNLLKVRVELRMATRLVSDLEKQLYGTPKSRAGVTPETKQPTAQEVVARELADLDLWMEDDE